MRWITVVILALSLGMAERVAAQIGTAREIFGDLLVVPGERLGALVLGEVSKQEFVTRCEPLVKTLRVRLSPAPGYLFSNGLFIVLSSDPTDFYAIGPDVCEGRKPSGVYIPWAERGQIARSATSKTGDPNRGVIGEPSCVPKPGEAQCTYRKNERVYFLAELSFPPVRQDKDVQLLYKTHLAGQVGATHHGCLAGCFQNRRDNKDNRLLARPEPAPG